ncbi:MAG TPA: signal peptidase I [Ktedonobacteraceae bacterium]|nr:signal peptidase I [Ktedonobacteraceae bacterium]
MKHSSHLVREIIETLALTLVIFVVIHFTVQNYMVDGPSMQPGLTNNQYVLVNKLAYLFHAPERGDVIVFHWPIDTNKDLIKRVIGVPGDVIVIDSKTVRVNGVLLNEPYIMAPVNPAGNKWVVPPNEYFAMGDNRLVSDDSRDWGFVPKSYIVGKAVFVYWPINSWHFIDTYGSVYSTIPTKH